MVCAEYFTAPVAVAEAELHTLLQLGREEVLIFALTASTRLASAQIDVTSHVPVTSPPQGTNVEAAHVVERTVPDPLFEPPVPASPESLPKSKQPAKSRLDASNAHDVRGASAARKHFIPSRYRIAPAGQLAIRPCAA